MIRAFLLVLLISTISQADKVFLSNGNVVEGDIIGKSAVIVKVFIEGYQRPIMIERTAIDSIEFEGKKVSFDSLKLKSEESFNPANRVTPRFRNLQVKKQERELFEKNLFEKPVQADIDTIIKDTRRQNLLFNAPTRWGSIGIGYGLIRGLTALQKRVSQSADSNLHYGANGIDIKTLSLQFRHNFKKYPGTVVAEFGYGKTALGSVDTLNESAQMRYFIVRYVLCKSQWLFSPGLSTGFELTDGMVTKRLPEDVNFKKPILQFPFKNAAFRLVLGLDFNLYDVISFNVLMPLSGNFSKETQGSLIFLIPFRT